MTDYEYHHHNHNLQWSCTARKLLKVEDTLRHRPLLFWRVGRIQAVMRKDSLHLIFSPVRTQFQFFAWRLSDRTTESINMMSSMHGWRWREELLASSQRLPPSRSRLTLRKTHRHLTVFLLSPDVCLFNGLEIRFCVSVLRLVCHCF
jgi:hypothetical protein